MLTIDPDLVSRMVSELEVVVKRVGRGWLAVIGSVTTLAPQAAAAIRMGRIACAHYDYDLAVL
jgi:hypothetical protein